MMFNHIQCKLEWRRVTPVPVIVRCYAVSVEFLTEFLCRTTGQRIKPVCHHPYISMSLLRQHRKLWPASGAEKVGNTPSLVRGAVVILVCAFRARRPLTLHHTYWFFRTSIYRPYLFRDRLIYALQKYVSAWQKL